MLFWPVWVCYKHMYTSFISFHKNRKSVLSLHMLLGSRKKVLFSGPATKREEGGGGASHLEKELFLKLDTKKFSKKRWSISSRGEGG